MFFCGLNTTKDHSELKGYTKVYDEEGKPCLKQDCLKFVREVMKLQTPVTKVPSVQDFKKYIQLVDHSTTYCDAFRKVIISNQHALFPPNGVPPATTEGRYFIAVLSVQLDWKKKTLPTLPPMSVSFKNNKQQPLMSQLTQSQTFDREEDSGDDRKSDPTYQDSSGSSTSSESDVVRNRKKSRLNVKDVASNISSSKKKSPTNKSSKELSTTSNIRSNATTKKTKTNKRKKSTNKSSKELSTTSNIRSNATTKKTKTNKRKKPTKQIGRKLGASKWKIKEYHILLCVLSESIAEDALPIGRYDWDAVASSCVDKESKWHRDGSACKAKFCSLAYKTQPTGTPEMRYVYKRSKFILKQMQKQECVGHAGLNDFTASDEDIDGDTFIDPPSMTGYKSVDSDDQDSIKQIEATYGRSRGKASVPASGLKTNGTLFTRPESRKKKQANISLAIEELGKNLLSSGELLGSCLGQSLETLASSIRERGKVESNDNSPTPTATSNHISVSQTVSQDDLHSKVNELSNDMSEIKQMLMSLMSKKNESTTP